MRVLCDGWCLDAWCRVGRASACGWPTGARGSVGSGDATTDQGGRADGAAGMRHFSQSSIKEVIL